MACNGTAKRTFVDIADRRRLGHLNKRARTNAADSKAILGTYAARALLGIAEEIESMDDRLEAACQHRALVQDAVDDPRFVPTALFCIEHLQEVCKAGLHDARELQSDWATSTVLGDLVPFRTSRRP